MECLRLRVKDIDFTNNQIVVRAGKGDKDRHMMLPAAVKEPLAKHLDGINSSTDAILSEAWAELLCRMRLSANIPTRGKS